MAEKDREILAASTNVDEAIDTRTAIDEEELLGARLHERWRDFCLNAERYVAETTRSRPQIEQTV
jgi:hypothetical protein